MKPVRRGGASGRAHARGKASDGLTTPQRKIIASFRQQGMVTAACESAGVSRTSHYKAMDKSAAYRAAFADAREEAADRIESEAYRRAVEGVDKPVFYQGKQCGVIREYSDRLLIRLLAARKPKEYGTERREISGPDGGPIQNQSAVDLSKLTDDELDELCRLTAKIEGVQP